MFFLLTGSYWKRCNKRYILCLQLWCCHRLWSGCFLISSFKWITIDGYHKMHVFWEIISPWWRPSLGHHLFCLFLVRIFLYRITFLIHFLQGNFMQYKSDNQPLTINLNCDHDWCLFTSIRFFIVASVILPFQLRQTWKHTTQTHTHTNSFHIDLWFSFFFLYAYTSTFWDPYIHSCKLQINEQWIDLML
jgi:hypothetical protein